MPSQHVDIHLAAKVAQDLNASIATFKDKLQTLSFGELDAAFSLVPPSFVLQHLPSEVERFKSYFSKFQKGATNVVSAFAKWYEWCSYEAGKHGGHKPSAQTPSSEGHGDAGSKAPTGSRAALAEVAKERSHIRALLAMCLRHNSGKRREGQHALVNYLNGVIPEGTPTNAQDAAPSVTYGLTRLVVGMATENVAAVVLNCHTLHLVLLRTRVHPRVVLHIIGDELALDARMKAYAARRSSDESLREEVDPDDIADPTKGERNQKVAAAIFSLAAVVFHRSAVEKMSPADIGTTVQYLCFCFVEHKGLRVLSANVLFHLLKVAPLDVLEVPAVRQWLEDAFFRFPKLEYFRPEAVQLLLRFWSLSEPRPAAVTGILMRSKLEHEDPLSPSMLEQIGGALFRDDRVTSVHPMIHPVWQDFVDLIKRRCDAGESLKQHVSSFIHNLVLPYRRGSWDSPRTNLFSKLMVSVGSLAMQHQDVGDRLGVVRVAAGTTFSLLPQKSTPWNELKQLPLQEMATKVSSLVTQLGRINSERGAPALRSWTLKELRSCLAVPYRDGSDAPFVDTAAMALLQEGFFPGRRNPADCDDANANRAAFIFAEVFSFTFEKPGGLCRLRTNVRPLALISTYLSAEEASLTRYNSAVKCTKFRKARNRIVEALEQTTRSILFYDCKDIHVLMTLLFLVESVDDPTNAEALNIATSVVPDLAKFYLHGTLEAIDVFVDLLMALVLRTAAPLHVLPLMSAVRRCATGFLYKFARFIRSKTTVDIVLAPLAEVYHTNVREETVAADKGGDGDASVHNDDEIHDASSDASSESDAASDSADEAAGEDESDEDASTQADDSESEDNSDSDSATEDDEETVEPDDDDDDGKDEDAFVEEEPATQQYLSSLQNLVGNVDLGFAYPTDSENQQKNAVVRSITIATRVGLGMKSPHVVSVFQVLLRVMRAELKEGDSVLFNAARSSIEMLLFTRQRYFGAFLAPQELFLLLGDIQAYCRKLARSLDLRAGLKQASAVRKRLVELKVTALRVFHFLCFLAFKNHGGPDVQITFSEFYRSIYCDRGWEARQCMRQLKMDLYHYRHAFAWALLPAAVTKFEEVKAVDGAQRAFAFRGACELVEAMLPRMSGLPAGLKEHCASTIRRFVEGLDLAAVYEMKQTEVYTMFHVWKLTLEYNSRVQASVDVVGRLVEEVVARDDIQVTKATIRVVAAIESILGLTPKVRETKAPVPAQVLYKQFETKWRKAKSDFYRRVHIATKKTTSALLSHRNGDPTDEERAKKRRRHEGLVKTDRVERQVLREARSRELTKEEKDARRQRITQAKQERIAKNKERKRQLHERREASFVRWRNEKLQDSGEK